MKVYLHRRNKALWIFEPSPKYGRLVHTTRYGTVYAIFWDIQQYVSKPVWIGLRIPHFYDKGDSWVTVEREIRADYLEFENGAKYYFPK